MDDYRQSISEYLKSQYDFEFGLSNILDIKTSIILALIIFLAAQSVELSKAVSMPLHWRVLQYMSASSLIVAVFSAIHELWPRHYYTKAKSAEFVGWVRARKEHYEVQKEPNPEARIADDIFQKEIEGATLLTKLRALNAAFYCTVAALILNFATLVALAFGWRF
jgi:hypothetical protein